MPYLAVVSLRESLRGSFLCFLNGLNLTFVEIEMGFLTEDGVHFIGVEINNYAMVSERIGQQNYAQPPM